MWSAARAREEDTRPVQVAVAHMCTISDKRSLLDTPRTEALKLAAAVNTSSAKRRVVSAQHSATASRDAFRG